MKRIVQGLIIFIVSFSILTLAAMKEEPGKAKEIEYPSAFPEDLVEAERLKKDAEAREREFEDQSKKKPDDEIIQRRLDVARSDAKTADLSIQLYTEVQQGKTPDELQPLQQQIVDQQQERLKLIGELQKTFIPAGGEGLTEEQTNAIAIKLADPSRDLSKYKGIQDISQEISAMEKGQSSVLLPTISYTTEGGFPNYNAQSSVLTEIKNFIEKTIPQPEIYGSAPLKLIYKLASERLDQITNQSFSIPRDNAVAQDLSLGEKINQDRELAIKNFIDNWPKVSERYATVQEKLDALNQLDEADMFYGTQVMKDGTRPFDLRLQYRSELKAQQAKFEAEKRAELDVRLDAVKKNFDYKNSQNRQQLIDALKGFSETPLVQSVPDIKAGIDERVLQLTNYMDQPRPDFSPDLVPTLKDHLNEFKLDEKIPQDQLETLKADYANNLDSIIKEKNTQKLKDYLELIDMYYRIKDKGLDPAKFGSATQEAAKAFAETLQSTLDSITPEEPPQPAQKDIDDAYDPNIFNNPEAFGKAVDDMASTVSSVAGKAKETVAAATGKIAEVAGAPIDKVLTTFVDKVNTTGEFLQSAGKISEKVADFLKTKKGKFIVKVVDALYKVSPDLGRSVISGAGQLIKNVDFVFKTNYNKKFGSILAGVEFAKRPTIKGFEFPFSLQLNPAAKVVGVGLDYGGGLMSYLGGKLANFAGGRPTTTSEAMDAVDTIDTIDILVDRYRNNPNFKDPTYAAKAKTVFDTAVSDIKDHVTTLFAKDSPLDKAKNDYDLARKNLLTKLGLPETANAQEIQQKIEGFVPSSRKELLKDYLQATSNLLKAYQDVLSEMEGDFAGFQFLIDGWDTVSTGPAADIVPIAGLVKFGFDMVEQRTAYLNAAKEAAAGLAQDINSLTSADPAGKLFQQSLEGFVNKNYVDTIANFYTGAQKLSTEMKTYKDQVRKTLENMIKQQSQ